MKIKLPSDLHFFFKKIIKINKKQQNSSKKALQELSSIEHLNENVEKIFKVSELAFSNNLYNLFRNNGYNQNDLKEKTHLIVNIIDNSAHEEAYHKHPNLNYDNMDNIIIDSIINILFNLILLFYTSISLYLLAP